MKRFWTFFLAIVLLFANSVTTYACDEKQSKHRVAEILFGDDALSYSSDENAKIEDCMVSSLEIKLSSSDKNLQVVLPGGIYAKSGAEDIIQAYGEPTSEEGSDSDKDLNYEYTTEDEDAWICNVEMELNDTKKPLETVKYPLTDDNWGGSKEDVLTYVDTNSRFYYVV